MKKPLRILHLEDNALDAELVESALSADGIECEVTKVMTREDYRSALEACGFDLVLADFALPSFDGMSALEMASRTCLEVPYIFVSGSMGEEVAVESLKKGAVDYVLKTNLSRLAPAVRRALREADDRAAR
ncbi:MAG TPA: response regulator, partial [Nitrospirota bacterium]|nr:response regulator [Nitrospirota bacterium]